MKLYVFRYLCPACAEMHEVKICAATLEKARDDFERVWRQVGEILGDYLQLPLYYVVFKGYNCDEKE